MAWNKIVAACGHSYHKQLYGPGAGREKEVAWLSGRECPDCYAARIAAERAAATEAAKEANTGLPALTGSPKQIEWAETIRAKGIKQLRELLAKIDAIDPESYAGQEEKIAKAREIIADRMARSDSKYWIDNRASTWDLNWLTKAVEKLMEPVKL